MIPRRYIEEWKEFAPWPEDSQVEQDLVIEKALFQLYSDPFLKERLAFRGGTALNKLFLDSPLRYSEDIDLVQIHPEPIKDTIDSIRRQLDFLGKPVIKQKANNNTLLYHFESEIPPVIKLRLKIEINCREHFSVLGYKEIRREVKNGWFKGSVDIKTYEAEEILGTKLRALYQRRKGRDLFDLYYALTTLKLKNELILRCYNEYMTHSVSNPPSQKLFLINIDQKIEDPDFIGDLKGILRSEIKYNQFSAYQLIKSFIEI